MGLLDAAKGFLNPKDDTNATPPPDGTVLETTITADSALEEAAEARKAAAEPVGAETTPSLPITPKSNPTDTSGGFWDKNENPGNGPKVSPRTTLDVMSPELSIPKPTDTHAVANPVIPPPPFFKTEGTTVPKMPEAPAGSVPIAINRGEPEPTVSVPVEIATPEPDQAPVVTPEAEPVDLHFSNALEEPLKTETTTEPTAPAAEVTPEIGNDLLSALEGSTSAQVPPEEKPEEAKPEMTLEAEMPAVKLPELELHSSEDQGQLSQARERVRQAEHLLNELEVSEKTVAREEEEAAAKLDHCKVRKEKIATVRKRTNEILAESKLIVEKYEALKTEATTAGSELTMLAREIEGGVDMAA